ncbi:MAG: hypothetical protein ABIF71_07480 [Planctomycetota bacterium]
MQIRFKLGWSKGTITVKEGRAAVEYPNPELRKQLAEAINTAQDVTFRVQGAPTGPSFSATRVVPASDDGTLVCFLMAGVPGIRKKIKILEVTGSDKVSLGPKEIEV